PTGDRIRIEGGRGPSRMLETTPPCVNSVRRYGTAKIESVSCEHQSQVGRAIGAHGARMKLRPDGQCVLPARTRSFGRSSAVKLDLLGLLIDRGMPPPLPAENGTPHALRYLPSPPRTSLPRDPG